MKNLKKIFLLSYFIVVAVLLSHANNGKIGYIYPVENISIDGDLSDWPSSFHSYPLDNYLFDNPPDGDKDLKGHFKIGYQQSTQSIYVGVEVFDDEIVRNPANPIWTEHDLQVLYIDPLHTKKGAGTIGYEINLDTSQIVHQDDVKWYDQVAKASWDNVEVKMKINGNKLIYEWKIFIGKQLIPGATIGFDYVLLDKDGKDFPNFSAWGPRGSKHEDSEKLGDMILMDPKTELGTIKGQIKWAKESKFKPPNIIEITSKSNPDFWLRSAVDSNGYYTCKLPKGDYSISLLDRLMTPKRDVAFRINSEKIKINIKPNELTVAPILNINVLTKPDLLTEQGILIFNPQNLENKIDQFIKSYQEYYQIPGVSLAIIQDGKVSYHQTYGVQNTINNIPVHEKSLFEAASITKTVFAYLMARLVERKIIDLEKPLYQYLPFEELEEDERYKLMTGKHVLTHMTGLPNWGRYMKETPGTKHGYSGEGFEYLKRVVVKITGKSIDQLLQEEVIEPLELSPLYFCEGDYVNKWGVSGHRDFVPTIQFPAKEPGMAFSMLTEAKAFAGFAIGLLERKGLKEETWKSFFELHTPVLPEEGEPERKFDEGFGMGIYVKDSAKGMAFSHGGNNGDFKCKYEVFQNLKAGFVIFTNSDHGDFLHRDMAAFLIEGKAASNTE